MSLCEKAPDHEEQPSEERLVPSFVPKPTAMPPRSIRVGTGSLLIGTEDFLNGYQAGYLSYMKDAYTTVFTEKQLITLLMERLESLDCSEPYSVGFVVGWISTLALKGTHAPEEAHQ